MKTIGRFILKLIGWKIIGDLPEDKKYMIIVAPHTSNWDLVIGLCARFALGVRITFLAKKQVFFFPLGAFLTAVGGVPVDRTRKDNTVQQVVDLYNHSDKLILAITPEGTRSPVTRWKEGFYHIAVQAAVPIVMVGFDYPSKEIRISELFSPSGQIEKDFLQIVAYFRVFKGRHPKEIPDYHSKE